MVLIIFFLNSGSFLDLTWGLCLTNSIISSLPRSFASYFMTSIPKVNPSSNLGDFRPISLLGSLYKLVAKVLATRLEVVMEKLISPSQSTFFKGRMLVDGVVVINEVVNLSKRSKYHCLILKVDFEKSYYLISWNLLDYKLIRFEFSQKRRYRMKAYVFASNIAVMVK